MVVLSGCPVHTATWEGGTTLERGEWISERKNSTTDQRPPTLARLNLTYIPTGYYKSGAEVTRLEDTLTDAGIWSGKGGESYVSDNDKDASGS